MVSTGAFWSATGHRNQTFFLSRSGPNLPGELEYMM